MPYKLNELNMRLIFLTVVLFFAVNATLSAQVEYPDTIVKTDVKKEENAIKTDLIKTFDGKVLKVNVKKFTPLEVFYSQPGETKMSSIERRLVNTIKYKSGRLETINTELKVKKKKKDYRKVKVLRKKRDTENHIEIGKIEAKREGAEGEFVTIRELERNAIIELKKRAALLNADYIYVYDRESSMGYGDIPSLTLYAKAYRKK